MNSSALLTSVNVNSTPAAYIMSHSTFNFGQQLSQFYRIDQRLLFYGVVKPIALKIEFLYIDIGCTSNYNNDTGYVKSLGSTDPQNTFTCYNLTLAIPPQLYQSNSESDNYVGFSLMLNNDVLRGGYLLKYSGMFFLPISYTTSCRQPKIDILLIAAEKMIDSA